MLIALVVTIEQVELLIADYQAEWYKSKLDIELE